METETAFEPAGECSIWVQHRFHPDAFLMLYASNSTSNPRGAVILAMPIARIAAASQDSHT